MCNPRKGIPAEYPATVYAPAAEYPLPGYTPAAPAAPAEPRCRNGHGLVWITAENSAYVCDVCGKAILEGEKHLTCTQCQSSDTMFYDAGFDACNSCSQTLPRT